MHQHYRFKAVLVSVLFYVCEYLVLPVRTEKKGTSSDSRLCDVVARYYVPMESYLSATNDRSYWSCKSPGSLAKLYLVTRVKLDQIFRQWKFSSNVQYIQYLFVALFMSCKLHKTVHKHGDKTGFNPFDKGRFILGERV